MKKNVLNYTFGNRLKELRNKKGLTLDAFTQKYGFALDTYKSWEKGNDNITAHNLNKLADCFNVPTDYLLLRTDYVTVGNEAIQERTGLSAAAIDYMSTGHRDLVSAVVAAAAKTTLEDQNIDTSTPSAAILLSQLIEDAPVEFIALIREINRFLSMSDDQSTGSHEWHREASEYTCTKALGKLLDKARTSPRFIGLSRTLLIRQESESIQALYDTNNPHIKKENSPEA